MNIPDFPKVESSFFYVIWNDRDRGYITSLGVAVPDMNRAKKYVTIRDAESDKARLFPLGHYILSVQATYQLKRV